MPPTFKHYSKVLNNIAHCDKRNYTHSCDVGKKSLGLKPLHYVYLGQCQTPTIKRFYENS